LDKPRGLRGIFVPKNQGNRMIESKRNLLSIPEFAGELGVTEACIRTWIQKRQIAIVKIGRLVRIKRETIQELIERGTVPALQR
jgi:excisionase family DNA binding protein